MNRLRCAVGAGILGLIIPGCGEDQPNHPATGDEVNKDFAQQSVDMMRKANSGMDPKQAKAVNTPPAKK
jgi:hypothetical protein